MKILHIVEAWHGGISVYVRRLIDAQIGDGHIVCLVADTKLAPNEFRGMKCEIATYTSSRNVLNIFSIRNELISIVKSRAPDVIHAHSTFPGLYARFPFPLHPRVIFTPHGWSFLKSDILYVTKHIYQVVERLLAQRCAIIICMSREELNRAQQIGIPNDVLTLIYTGIDDLSCSKDRHAVTRISSYRLNIGFIGRLNYQKGADLLPEFVSRLNRDVVLHVFGTGDLDEDYVHSLGNVVFHGWVANERLSSLISDMDLIVMPSRWEGFSLAALEVIRLGKPVFVSGCTSLSEIVIDGFNGRVMQEYTAECLADLVNSATCDELSEMGYNARYVFISRFSFDRFYSSMKDVYSTVILKRNLLGKF